MSAASMAASRRSRPIRCSPETAIASCLALQSRAFFGRKQVDLVQHLEDGLVLDVKLRKDRFNLLLLLVEQRAGGVADVQQHLGALHLFERGAEAGDERVRQVADEADGIGQQDLAPAGQLKLRQLGVERGEHARGLEHAGFGERVEQRALAGVGVADQRDDRDRHGLAALALLAADAANRLELLLDVVDAQVDLAAVGLELGFAGAARADAAAELGHGVAAAGEARKLVFELGELDLQLAFARARVAGEDVEDELRAVDDAAGQPRFEVAQLRGREVVVEEDEVGIWSRRLWPRSLRACPAD